jgi:hypothetical protein
MLEMCWKLHASPGEDCPEVSGSEPFYGHLRYHPRCLVQDLSTSISNCLPGRPTHRKDLRTPLTTQALTDFTSWGGSAKLHVSIKDTERQHPSLLSYSHHCPSGFLPLPVKAD